MLLPTIFTVSVFISARRRWKKVQHRIGSNGDEKKHTVVVKLSNQALKTLRENLEGKEFQKLMHFCCLDAK